MKTYIAPQIEVTEVEVRSTIMAASTSTVNVFDSIDVEYGSNDFEFAAPDSHVVDWFNDL